LQTSLLLDMFLQLLKKTKKRATEVKKKKKVKSKS
jgi:hypothetical protein